MATTEIQQAAIYRCTDKATREVFYVVKSDRQDAWYTLRFDAVAAEWCCDCPAKKPCKHIRAVVEILKIRRARLAKKIGGDMPAIVAEIQAEPVVLRDGEGMMYVMRGGMYCCMSAHDLVAAQRAYREGDEYDRVRLQVMLADPTKTSARQCEIWGDDGQALYGPVPVAPTAAARRAAFEAVTAQVRAIEARAKTVSCKRAKQFAHLPLNGNADFGLLKSVAQ